MAIKKRKSRVVDFHPRTRWQSDVICEMLAWLDICRERSPKTKDGQRKSFELSFKNSIVGRLKNRFHLEFTLKQIEWKLKNIWEHQGKQESKVFTELYIQGTALLVEDYIKSNPKIRERFAEIQIEERSEKLMSFFSPRSSRSQYRNSPGLHHISLDERMEDISPTPISLECRSRSGTVTLDLGASMTPESQEQVMVTKLETPTYQISDSLSLDSSPTLTSIAASEKYPSFTDAPQSRCQGQPSIVVEIPARPKSRRRRRRSRRSRRRNFHSTVSFESPQSDEKIAYDDFQKEVDKLRMEKDEEIRYLDRELSSAQKVIKDLRSELKSCNSTLALLSNGDSSSIIETVRDQQKHIEHLKDTLNNRRYLRQFSTLEALQSPPFDREEIQTLMSTIRFKLEGLMSDGECQEHCNLTILESTTNLDPLLCKSFGVRELRVHDTAWVDTVLPEISIQALIWSLVSSALCEWVFERDSQDLFPTPCKLLDIYRSHLDTQDGEIALRNLDFAAHQTLIEKDYFQKHIVTRQVSSLVNRFLETVAPLFTLHKPLPQWEMDVLKMWRQEEDRLERIFRAALEIKLMTILSKYRFQAFVFAPGTAYSQVLMNPIFPLVESEKGRSSDRHHCVRLTLLPGLGQYMYNRKMVEYSTFVSTGSAVQDLDVLTKASVIEARAE